jgi:hypothetical protein
VKTFSFDARREEEFLVDKRDRDQKNKPKKKKKKKKRGEEREFTAIYGILKLR